MRKEQNRNCFADSVAFHPHFQGAPSRALQEQGLAQGFCNFLDDVCRGLIHRNRFRETASCNQETHQQTADPKQAPADDGWQQDIQLGRHTGSDFTSREWAVYTESSDVPVPISKIGTVAGRRDRAKCDVLCVGLRDRQLTGAHANIAFLKYWGVKDRSLNLPYTNSLSMTLSHAHTTTSLSPG